MSKHRKSLPEFAGEAEERAFRETRDKVWLQDKVQSH
jgi:hypothetical protein